MTRLHVQLKRQASRGAVLLGRCKVATQPPALDIPEPKLQNDAGGGSKGAELPARGIAARDVRAQLENRAFWVGLGW